MDSLSLHRKKKCVPNLNQNGGQCREPLISICIKTPIISHQEVTALSMLCCVGHSVALHECHIVHNKSSGVAQRETAL